MKHLKMFDNFKEKDYVKCIDGGRSFNLLKYNNIYQIEYITKSQLKLNNIEFLWDFDRFKIATKDEIITHNSNKFNI